MRGGVLKCSKWCGWGSTIFLPVRGGVLKSHTRTHQNRCKNSSPCGEVYWNRLINGEASLYRIPPRAGRCIEIFLTLIVLYLLSFLPVRGGVLKFKHRQRFCNWAIPPRAGRCIEILFFLQVVNKHNIPPHAGRCIEIHFIKRNVCLYDHSSPCGEVYWNVDLFRLDDFLLFLPVRGGVLKSYR